jgi:hypothetical protein
MSKKNRNKKSNVGSVLESVAPLALSPAARSKSTLPTVLFAVGEADFGYSETKILRLADRLRVHGEWRVRIATHDPDTLKEAKKLGFDSQLVAIESPGVTVDDRLRATDEMIRETANIDIPGSTLPLWKVLAMDDFLSSLQLFGAQPSETIDADVVVAPLMAVDNNTRATCGLYTWLVAGARQKGIPVVGLEVSPLGNKNTISHLPADHYAVKTEWSKNFLVREGLARAEQVSVLRWEESYCLVPGKDEYVDAYLESEAKMRDMLNVSWDEFIILIPHHVAFLWEARKILEALASLARPFTVVVRVEAKTTRRQYPEREIVLRSYEKEIRRLPRVLIDERIGVGLLLQLADLVVSPFAGTTTERAALCRKPTIVCQAMGQSGFQEQYFCWEPRPEKIPALIEAWIGNGWLPRPRFARILTDLATRRARAAA